MKNILLLLFFTYCTFSFSQNVKTKFIRSGVLVASPGSTIQTVKFKKGKTVFLIKYVGADFWEVNYNGEIGSVVTPYIKMTNEATKMKEKYDQEIQKIDQRNDSIERIRIVNKRKKDSIKKVKLKNKLLIEKKKEDSIAKAYQNKLKIARQKIEDEEAEKLKKYQSKCTQNNKQECCQYAVNEVDEFTRKRRMRTTYFTFSGETKYNEPSIELVKYGALKYVIFDAKMDLGCVSPYSTSKSYVKVKLENGIIVTFYHFNDIDCGNNFRLYGKLTEKDIYNLKRSPVKSIRMSGTEYYHDFTNIVFKNLFRNKLDCIK